MLINKRKLIQLFLSELQGERQYLEFKASADFQNERGKASIAKVICGLANGNGANRSYVVYGIEDGTGNIQGISPIDDQQFQQLVRNLLDPAPSVLFENVALSESKPPVVGLLTIYPSQELVKIRRNIWKLKTGDVFRRVGSENLREYGGTIPAQEVQAELGSVEAKAAASLEGVIQDVVTFHTETPPACNPRFLVFHDRHTLCFSGLPDEGNVESEAFALLAGEGVKLFWGALQYVVFGSTESSFSVVEHIPLFWNGVRVLTPIEETVFKFKSDGGYFQERRFIFEKPAVTEHEIQDLLKAYGKDLEKFRLRQYNSMDLSPRAEIYCHELLVAMLNHSEEAKQHFFNYLDGEVIDGSISEGRTEAMRFLERIENGIAQLAEKHDTQII